MSHSEAFCPDERFRLRDDCRCLGQMRPCTVGKFPEAISQTLVSDKRYLAVGTMAPQMRSRGRALLASTPDKKKACDRAADLVKRPGSVEV